MASTRSRPELSVGSERRLRWLYWAAALGLAPWIAYLYVSQTPRAPAHDVRTLVSGLLAMIIVGCLVTTWAYAISHPLATVAASFTATATFISAWFRTLTRTGTTGWAGSGVTFALIAAVVVTSCVVMIRRGPDLLASPGTGSPARPPQRWLVVGLLGTAVVLAPSLLIVWFAVPTVGIARHLRVVWTGLDVFELLALAATGLALSMRSVATVVAATTTGTLLVCDAWINVVPTTGGARAEGLLLTLIEIPLALVSFWVALRVTRRVSRAW